MRRLLSLSGCVALGLAFLAGPAGAQDDSISVTPADGLLDGDMVTISATTTGSTYATLGLCPADAAPTVGTSVIDLVGTVDICVGLACLGPDDDEGVPGLAEFVAPYCPVSVAPAPISSIDVTVPLPRITDDGTDCAVDACVVVFNTWTGADAQGAVQAVVTFDESVPPPTTVAPVPPVETTTTTTTTIALSAPTSAAPPPTTVAPPTTAAPPATVPTQVLGTTETNDGELAHTGLDAGLLAAGGVALIAAGALVGRRSRRIG